MRIAITQRVLHHKGRAYDSLEQSWWDLLKSHQLIPIPNTTFQNLTQTLDTVDLIILSGGEGNEARAQVETEIFDYVDEHKTPVLGVCRGMHLVADRIGLDVIAVDNHMDTEHTIVMSDRKYTVPSHHSLAVRSGNNIDVLALDMEN